MSGNPDKAKAAKGKKKDLLRKKAQKVFNAAVKAGEQSGSAAYKKNRQSMKDIMNGKY